MASSGAYQHENDELLLYFLTDLKIAFKENKDMFGSDLQNQRNSRIWHTTEDVDGSSLKKNSLNQQYYNRIIENNIPNLYHFTLFSLSQAFNHSIQSSFILLVLSVTNSLGILWILNEIKSIYDFP